jgi:RNA polymerase sigma-70 factor, Bacteroides expansion family 1
MMDFSDDKTLLNSIKSGDNEAFEYLFKAYYPRLYRYAIRFLKDEDIAHDIIQECFMHIWEKRTTLSAISIASLLFAMVRNGCLNYIKHLSIVEKYQIDTKAEGEEHLYYADFFLDAEHKLLYDELQEQIRIVMDNLSPRSREIFIMSRFRGLKNREIAEILNISTTAVEKQISKTLRCFSDHFKNKYPLDIYIVIIAWLIR